MRYFRAFQYMFNSPRWLTNLLLVAVAPFVPVAGAMVILGYQFQIVEALHLRGEEDYPDFDINRLADYLIRGAWPLLVMLVVTLPLTLVACIVGVVLVVVLQTVMLAGPGTDPTTFLVTFYLSLGGLILVVMLLQVPLALVFVPMILRAGLCQDFMAAFSWSFIRDFAGRMWLEILLAEGFLIVSRLVLGTVGMMACCVGSYPALALAALAEAYLWFELYDLYLKRGGQPVPLKVEEV